MNNGKKKKKNKRRLKITLLCTAGVLIVALVAAGYMLLTASTSFADEGGYIVDDFRVADGVTVNGEPMGGKTPDEARALIKQSAQQMLNGLTLTVNFNGEPHAFTAAELGVSTDADDIAYKVADYAKDGDYRERSAALETARNNGADFKISYVLDQSKAQSAIKEATADFNVAPKDATAKFENGSFTYTKEQTGYDVDSDALMAAIANKLNSGDFTAVNAPMTVTQPKITEEDLRNNTSKMASYTTSKLGSDNRRYNIKKLADIVNGTVIMPGETWSINAAAGDRTTAAGWKDANGITGGRFVLQPGGGVCQVSSTLYNAAIRAELEIAERIPHSIPSTYVPLGLDATINSGPNGQDLKLKNNYDYPVYLVSQVEGDKITCAIYGPKLNGYKVDFESEELEGTPEPEPDIIEDTQLPDGTPIALGESVVWREGREGRKAIVSKIKTYDDGKVEKEQFGGVQSYRAITSQIYQNTANGTYMPQGDGELYLDPNIDMGDVNIDAVN